MLITKKLRDWLEKNTSLKAGATDTAVREAVGKAIASQELTPEKYRELSTPESGTLEKAVTELSSTLKALRKTIDDPDDDVDSGADGDYSEEDLKRRKSRKRRKAEDMEEELEEKLADATDEEIQEEMKRRKSRKRRKAESEDDWEEFEGEKAESTDLEDVSDEDLEDEMKFRRRAKRRKLCKECGPDDEEKQADPEEYEDLEGKEMEDEEYEDTDMATPKRRRSAGSRTKSGNRSNLERMMVGDRNGVSSPRVKRAAEQYSSTKSAMRYPGVTEKGKPHPLAGQPVIDFTDRGGRQLDTPSDLDKAVAGVWAKFQVQTARVKSKSLAYLNMPEHDRDLLHYAMEKMAWNGSSDGGDLADIKSRRLHPKEQKALIDDATSGGLEAAPIVFDDQVIQTPLLYGELYPLVNTVPLDRGRRVEGVATGTVTASWGGVDDTAISLFDTTSYVSAFDTTIHRWEGAIRIGLDFLSDTPIDFGAHVTAQYGERLLEDLDDVIATGNGATQPEGIMNKTGATSVSFSGTTSIGNYESLRFGVAKPEHRANLLASAVFCGNETSYQRARAIPVGASDARRLGGQTATVGGVTNYSDYSWMGTPYKINESLSNQQIFYAILARYRMYRRRGLTMRTSTEGDTLIRRNEMLIVATARYGGQMERGAVIARTTDAPA